MRITRRPTATQAFDEVVGIPVEPAEAVADLAEFISAIRPPTPTETFTLALPAETYARLYDSIVAGEIQAYIEHHQRPGAFVFALLANDLAGAADESDGFTAHRLPEFVAWVRENLPPGAWGTDLAVRTWLAPQIVHALQLGRRILAPQDRCG